MGKTAIERLAEFVANTARNQYPPICLMRAKQAFLDTLGCVYLGHQSPSTHSAFEAASVWGAGDTAVYGSDKRLAMPWAAFVNGTAAHAFDLDDYTLQANDHPSAVLVSAVLAAANKSGSHFSGRDLLDAYLIGLEVIFRLGEAVNMDHYKLGWHTTSTLDSLGASASVSRLWQLNEGEVATALSLTTSMGSGYVSQFGTSGKALHAGFSAKSGVVAATLAQCGATAYMGALDGEVSFGSLLVPAGKTCFDEAFAKLGSPWGIEEFGLGAKIYPSCGYTHRSIDCAITLHQQLNLQSIHEIKRVTASLPDFHLAILPFAVPQNRTEALFSTAYCVALALATGNNRIVDFFDEALHKQEILDLTALVEVISRTPQRPEINVDVDDPDVVEVWLHNGRHLKAEFGRWTGAPGRELQQKQYEQKFYECIELSGRAVSKSQAEAVVNMVMGLDNVELSDLNKIL